MATIKIKYAKRMVTGYTVGNDKDVYSVFFASQREAEGFLSTLTDEKGGWRVLAVLRNGNTVELEDVEK